jgi:hypothetical protein
VVAGQAWVQAKATWITEELGWRQALLIAPAMGSDGPNARLGSGREFADPRWIGWSDVGQSVTFMECAAGLTGY